MKILLSGARGFIGAAASDALRAQGADIVQLTRAPVKAPHVLWNPMKNILPVSALEGFDAVIHLAGENLATHRWTPQHKQDILQSRVFGTKLLCDALAATQSPPRVIICASAVGYYGNRGDEILTEESSPGRGFLAEVCRAWEDAGEAPRLRGIRVVNTRFGMVLAKHGGALARLLPMFRAGMGGVLGNGKQWVSWMALDDLVSALLFILRDEHTYGPVNVTSPYPVMNRDFVHALAHALQRPALVPAPAFALRLMLGEMADEVLLASQRAIPEKLLHAGFSARFPHLDAALMHMLR